MEQFTCDKCQKLFTRQQLIDSVGTYQTIDSDTRGSGEAVYLKGENTVECDCGHQISVQHEHWDFPVGVEPNIKDDEQLKVSGASSIYK
ncbi:hypothetical protein CWE23_11880 [Idiomarina aquatica]|uniref:Uncharacterized protein n=1 Tax=Idiomarina aquatica TaxID=1327752 RepID=A0AA94EEF0_9GAMM|nr:hypothetical protein CWE23_11880 [Idiomarina aquatica]